MRGANMALSACDAGATSYIAICPHGPMQESGPHRLLGMVWTVHRRAGSSDTLKRPARARAGDICPPSGPYVQWSSQDGSETPGPALARPAPAPPGYAGSRWPRQRWMIAARPVLQAGGARARSSAWRSQVLPGAALPAPLFGCHIGFEGTTFKPIELIAILDLGALFEQAPFYKCGHASDDVDPIDRFAKKFAGFRDRSPSRLHDADRGVPAGSGCVGADPLAMIVRRPAASGLIETPAGLIVRFLLETQSQAGQCFPGASLLPLYPIAARGVVITLAKAIEHRRDQPGTGHQHRDYSRSQDDVTLS